MDDLTDLTSAESAERIGDEAAVEQVDLAADVAELRALVAEQREALAQLRADYAAMRKGTRGVSAVTGNSGDTVARGASDDTNTGGGWTRRGLLLGGLGAAAGAAASVAGAAPAAAGTGAMYYGAINDAGTSSTALLSSSATRALRITYTGSGNGLEANVSAGGAVAVRGTATGTGTGVLATSEGGVAVFAQASSVYAAVYGDSSAGPGVRGVSGNGPGMQATSGVSNGLEATAGGAGAAVRAYALSGAGVVARSQSGPNLRLIGTMTSLPALSSPGDVVALQATGGTTIELWLCVSSGSWRLLGSTAAAGAYVPIVPVRAYDSRWVNVPGVSTGVITPGTVRTISVANGRNNAGAITAPNAVPAGATAVTLNLTVDNTVERGNIAIVPGGVATSATSSINWSSTGMVVANGITVKLDPATRTVNALGRSNNANLIVDVTGYYAAA